MVRILHLADLHLGWIPPWEGLTFDREAERNARLAKAVDWAMAEAIDLIIIAGDLFEHYAPPDDLVTEAKRQLARAHGAGIAVVTVPGNHDEISYHNSVYQQHARDWPGLLVQNAHFDYCVTLNLSGQEVHIYGLAYTGGITRTHPPLADFPRKPTDGFHIAVLHGSVDFDAGDRSLPINLKALSEAGFHYSALGHIHKHLRYGSTTHPVVYAGMIEGKGFNDPGVDHYTVVTLREGGVAIETPPAHARRVASLSVDVGAYADERALIDSIMTQFEEGDILCLQLAGSPEFSLDVNTLRSAVCDKAAFVDIADESDRLSDDTLRTMAMEPTIRGAFALRMLQKIEEAKDANERRLVRRALLHGLAALEESDSA